MEIRSLQPLLKTYPFFDGMTDQLLEVLVGCATNLRFDEDKHIFLQGQPADQLYFIRQGEVALEVTREDGTVLAIQTLTTGDVLGWSWMFEPKVWQFDARPLSLTRVIAMDGDCISTRCEEYSELGYELMRRLATVVVKRLQAARQFILESDAKSYA